MLGVAATCQGREKSQGHGHQGRRRKEEPETPLVRQRGRGGGSHTAASEQGCGEQGDYRRPGLRHDLGGPGLKRAPYDVLRTIN